MAAAARSAASNISRFLEPHEDLYDGRDVLDSKHIALYVMLSFFSVVGVVGNAVAFYIFFRRRNAGTSVIFILALAGTDFITCLVIIPFSIVFEALKYRLYYDELCKTYMFFITSTIPYSSFIMAGIAFDRYFCICHPFLHVLNVQRARMVVLCLAIPAFIFGIITGMFYGIYIIQDYLIINGTVLLGTNISKEMAEHPVHRTDFIDVTDLGHVAGGHVMETEVMFVNDSAVYVLQMLRVLAHNGECIQNAFYFNETFQGWFQLVYTSWYAVCFVTVMVLYVLIYKFIFNRRAMKARRRRNNHRYVSVETQLPVQNRPTETAMTELNGNGSVHTKTIHHHLLSHLHQERQMATTSLIEEKRCVTTTSVTTTTTCMDGTAYTAAPTTTAATSATAAVTDDTTTASSAVPCAEKRGGRGGGNGRSGSDGGGGRDRSGSGRSLGRNSNGTTSRGSGRDSSRGHKRRGSTTRDRNLYANIKTAMMLFVVTLVFIIAFAPSWFMIHNVIPWQLNVFYLYFVYNVANPFIYAFMNHAFREDLKKLLKRS